MRTRRLVEQMLERTCAAQSAASSQISSFFVVTVARQARRSDTVPGIMSEKVELPKKKATANPGRLETEDMPPVTPRKRKARRTADSERSPHELGRLAIHAESTPRGVQGRRSDRRLACPSQPHFSEKGHSCVYPVDCAGTPTPKTSTDVARASSGVYGHAPSPQIQHVQSWFTTSQNQTGQCAPRPTSHHATAYVLFIKTSRS